MNEIPMLRSLRAMTQRAFAAFALLSAFTIATGYAQQPAAAVDGYVTRAVSAADFDQNGLKVVVTPRTKFSSDVTGHRGGPEAAGMLYVGEPVSIYGKPHRNEHLITATEIIFHAQAQSEVVGYAVIDRILSPLKSGEILVRADGYPIRINTATKIKFTSPLNSLSDATPNVWIAYKGALHSDETIIAQAAVLSPNVIGNREDKLIEKTDYDPSKVSDSAGQDPLRKLLFGADPKKVPPYHDAAMQARIDRIGKSLIPDYQKALHQSDETKILFQFQLVDGPQWRNAWALPSGVILVPRQIVESLQNDSQLAAVLADAVSCALEKQMYREQPSNTTKAIAELTSVLVGGGAVVSTVATVSAVTLSKYGYAGNIYGANGAVERQNQDQRGRVALSLMQDAGYDIDEAPKAWWALSAKDPNHVADSPMPDRAINLYRFLGAIWHNDADTLKPTTPPQSVPATVTQTK